MGSRKLSLAKSVQKLENLPLGSTKHRSLADREREVLIAQLLLSDGPGGDTVTFLTARMSPLRAFGVLRRLSGLKILLPNDLGELGGLHMDDKSIFIQEAHAHKSAGTCRWLKFPPFREVLDIVGKVQCFFMCRRLHSRREVADRLGWSEREVRKVDELLRKRLQSLKGIAW